MPQHIVQARTLLANAEPFKDTKRGGWRQCWADLGRVIRGKTLRKKRKEKHFQEMFFFSILTQAYRSGTLSLVMVC
jgi:hypothetical protein